MQKITYVTLFFVLFFITVAVFGGGAYMRKKIKRNIGNLNFISEIVMKTEEKLTQMTSTINEDMTMIQQTDPKGSIADRFQ